ncbi:DinB family protein [Terrimonas pollutisoli]|uniref:DinB family protein n=1 Tax=Terrimonas pollutisoli TaxID=3034147 RepID=UPI0023EC3F51|nr:DinB family protein [Terrimonas sp. H1YJ31]
MQQTGLNKKELLKQFEETEREFYNVLASFTQEQLNEVPFEGSWTAAQVADHMLKSKSGIPGLLRGPSRPTLREPDEMVEAINEAFLDFTTKLKSPDFIIPTDEPANKEELLQSLNSVRGNIKKASAAVDLSATITSFPFPGLGEFTGYEWIYFLVCHTKRHTHQLKNIFWILAKPW